MAILKEIESKAKYIKSVVDYVKKDAKTADGYYVEGINCDPAKATAEFLKVQRLWEKTDGRRYFHYVMSWDFKDDITPEKALEITKEWISQTQKMNGHQVLLAAHLDQKHGNIHVHIVGNSVNMVTGVKMHRNAKELADWKQTCNDINMQHGFQPPKTKTREEKRKNPTTWKKDEYQAQQKAAKQQKKGLKEIILESVIDAYTKATNRLEFISQLAEKGIETIWKDTKKNITFTATEEIEADTDKRTVRDSNLEKTFGFKCDKETLETRFQYNLEQQQTKEKEVLDAERERETAEITRIATRFRRRKRATISESTEEGAGDIAAFISKIDANVESSGLSRASAESKRAARDKEQERLTAVKRAEEERRIAEAKQRIRAAAEERERREQESARRATEKTRGKSKGNVLGG